MYSFVILSLKITLSNQPLVKMYSLILVNLFQLVSPNLDFNQDIHFSKKYNTFAS